jgi:hypothetical protein
MQILFEGVELALETRGQRKIKNELLKRTPTHGDILAARDFKARYSTCDHRPTEVSLKYNCHGLTFASRRTAITESDAVQSILDDDGYRTVNDDDVSVGDIVVYSEYGDFSHSGIVTRADPVGNAKVVWVLSKWGRAHEVVHKVRECPYAGHSDIQIRFWRIVQ